MAAAITVTQGALSAISTIHSFLGTPPTQAAKKQIARNWSFYAMCATGIIGTITTVVSFILGQFAITACAGLLALTGFLGAYELNRLRVMKDFDGYLEELSKKIQAFYGLLTRLQKTSGDLITATFDLGKASRKYKRTIETENRRLNFNLTSMKKVVEEFKSEQTSLEAINSKNEALIVSLESNQRAQLDTIERLNAEKETLTRLVTSFQSTQEIFRQDIAMAEATGTQLDSTNTQLKEQLASANEWLIKFSRLLSDPSTPSAIGGASSRLSSTSEELKRQSDELKEGARLFEAAISRFESLLERPEITHLARVAKEQISPTELATVSSI